MTKPDPKRPSSTSLEAVEKIDSPNTKGQQLTLHVVIGMVAGAVCGVLLNHLPDDNTIHQFIVAGVFKVIGQVFVASLKMLVVPLVFVSIVCGVVGLEDIKKLGRLGGKTLGLYLLTTGLAITSAIILAVLIKPGGGFEMSIENLQFTPVAGKPLTDVLIDMVPSNPIKAAADGKMLQIIVFAILFGVGLTISGKSGHVVADVFVHLNEVIMKIITMLMFIAPYGVFALIAKVFAEQGAAAILPLLSYFLLTLGVLLIHMAFTYGTLLKLFAGLNPLRFLAKLKPVLLFAFSTASSNTTIPVTMKTVTEKLGVSHKIAAFTVPLGATINMDGTAIMQGVATVFIAQAYGINISVADYATVVVMATLASIGTAGVPGVGLITLAMVLRQVGLPVEGIGLIIGVDRLLDMVRTAVNVTGDATVSCLVAKSENQLDFEAFKST